MANGRQAHWERVYETRAGNELSWYQKIPVISLALIRAAGVEPGAAIIDIGGGESRLVDALLDAGFHRPRPLGQSACGRQGPARTTLRASDMDRC